MVPLMVMFCPIVMCVGEAVIEMEPSSNPMHACTRIDVKTSKEANSKTVRCVVPRLLNFSLSLGCSSFLNYISLY